MNRRRLLAATGTALTAGCLRLASGDGGGSPTSGATATAPADGPAPPTATTRGATAGDDGPTPSEPAGEVEYPLGLSSDGPSLILVDNHINQLAGTSFTRTSTRTNVTDAEIWANQRVRVEDRFALLEFRHNDVERYVELVPGRYFPESWRAVINGAEVYGSLDICCVGSPRTLVDADYLTWVLSSGDFGRPEATADGFALSADTVENPDPVLNEFRAERIPEFSANGTVTEDGVVRRLSATVQIVRNDRLLEVENEYAVSDIGSTTVEQPGWVETARSRAPALQASIRDDRRGIVYDHTGGDPVIAGTTVGIHRHGSRALAADESSRLQEPLEPGQTLVAYVAGDRVEHSLGDLPSDADPEELPTRGWTDLNAPSAPPYYKRAIEDL